MNNVQGAFFHIRTFVRVWIGNRSNLVWRCSELGDMRQTLEASDVDIVALAHDNTLEGCQLTPGMAVSMQWLVPGSTLNGHAHAWWHLFISSRAAVRCHWGCRRGKRRPRGCLAGAA
jgi:gentisate 1,2-dioxygenase